MKKHVWSRDWANVDWNDIGVKSEGGKKFTTRIEGSVTKSPETGIVETEALKTDIGIMRDEFIEYLQWLAENYPKRYSKVVLGIRLRELGVEPVLAKYVCENSQKILEAFGITKQERNR